MATFETTRPVAAHSAGLIATFLTDLYADIVAWNDARITRKALSKLSARELDDIGLTVADLRDISTIIR